MAPWLYRSHETEQFDEIALHPIAEESAGFPYYIIIICYIKPPSFHCNFAFLCIDYTFLCEVSPVTRLRLHDYMLAEQLSSKPLDIGFSLSGLSAGRNGHTLYGLDRSCGKVIRIDIRNKQCRIIFDYKHSYPIYDMTSLSGNSRKGEILAILIHNDYPPHSWAVMTLEETEQMKFHIRARCALKTDGRSKWKCVMAGLKCGVAVYQCETTIIQVWRLCEQEAREFHIPCCESKIVGLCAMEDSLGRQDLFAVTFSNHSIRIFAILLNRLVKYRDLQLEFIPSRLLWLDSKQTLLISDKGWVPDELCALRVTGRGVTKYNVTIEDNQGFEVKLWCVLADRQGTEKGIAIFDCRSNSLKIFDMT